MPQVRGVGPPRRPRSLALGPPLPVFAMNTLLPTPKIDEVREAAIEFADLVKSSDPLLPKHSVVPW
jgi:hypothetical protein